MTTITEILAEAFNRVKAEHGVNLSDVEFEHYSGSLSGVTFKAIGNVQPVYSYPAFPPLAGQIPVAPCPVQAPQPPIAHTVDPNDCTHVGSVGVYNDCYWKFEGGVLYVWDGSSTWISFDSGEPAQRTVDSQLRAVNPDKGELVEMTPEKLAAMIAPAAPKNPSGATHFGSIDNHHDRYWRLTTNALYVLDGDEWSCYDNTAPQLVARGLTPLT